jgi:hypothetical protein
MDPERLKKRFQTEDEDAINAALGALLQHQHGKKLLWWLLRIGKIGMQPFAGNALNTSFNCGELNVGQQVLDRITSVSPEGYLNMMKEMADERTRRDSALADARTNSGAESDTYADSGADTDSEPDAG